MARLQNAMWERFAQALARGVTQTSAALEAGYSERSAHVRGSELAKKPEVRDRVAELQAKADREVARAIAVDRQWVLRELVANVEAAKASKNQNAVNRAIELIGKELGMFIDRKMDVKSPLDALNAQQLQALTAFLDQLRAEPAGARSGSASGAGAMQDAQVHHPAVDLGSANPANTQPA